MRPAARCLFREYAWTIVGFCLNSFSPSAFHVSLQTSTVQVSNPTTGSVMPLIKKIDVNDHFAARRKLRLAARGLMRQPAATAPSASETAPRKANVSEFGKDVSVENSALKLPEGNSK